MNESALQAGCWVEGASGSGFPISGLPYGVTRSGDGHSVVAAIGNKVLNLASCSDSGHLFVAGLDATALRDGTLNRLLGHPKSVLSALRQSIQALLCDQSIVTAVSKHLFERNEIELVCPLEPGDFIDFYASYHHALRSNKAARLDPPEPPSSWMSMPLGYFSRTSTIVGSGENIYRPSGVIGKPAGPVLAESRALDFELEIGVVTCGPSERIHVSPEKFSDRIFGIVLLNDWSARDIQGWESKPLGPFNAKSFATQIGDWVLPIEALEASRYKLEHQSKLVPHLTHDLHWGINLRLEVEIETSEARKMGDTGDVICISDLNCLHWDLAQLISHATLNKPLVRGADLFGTGTLSGASIGSAGCLLELTDAGRCPIKLSNGASRSWLENGDKITFRGYSHSGTGEPVRLGELSGMVTNSKCVC